VPEHECRGTIAPGRDCVHGTSLRRSKCGRDRNGCRSALGRGSPGTRTAAQAFHRLGRYQTSRRGRLNHAARSRRHRVHKNNVTHQGSPPDQSDGLLTEDRAVAVTELGRPRRASCKENRCRTGPLGSRLPFTTGQAIHASDGTFFDRKKILWMNLCCGLVDIDPSPD
jgi:hypothetical protein